MPRCPNVLAVGISVDGVRPPIKTPVKTLTVSLVLGIIALVELHVLGMMNRSDALRRKGCPDLELRGDAVSTKQNPFIVWAKWHLV